MTLNPADYHAYTDGTDVIIGTSIEEALAGFQSEAEGLNKGPGDMDPSKWHELPRNSELTIEFDDAPLPDEDDPDGEMGDPSIEKRNVADWITEHVQTYIDDEGVGLTIRHLCSSDT